MSDSAERLLDDPQVQPFLPLLFVAWADGEMTDAERAVFAQRLEHAPWLRPVAREAIRAWLDPNSPPSATSLANLRSVLAQAAGTLAPEARRSLAAIGEALGDASPESVTAREEIAALLGVEGMDAGIASPQEATTIAPASIDVAAIRSALDVGQHVVRNTVRAFLDDPAQRAYGLEKEDHRALVRGWLRELAETGLTRLAFPGVTSDAPDLSQFMVLFETLALGDLSLVVKAGVQLGLFGGSLYFLGTDRHRALLPGVASLETLGCFAMSEVGHGSNVADLETTATYDPRTRELVIHTPRESARKDWIGGAAEDARLATVFAQLDVDGVRHGVHAVLVPIRDAAGAPLQGVRIGDCGLKMGLNGVDNGRLYFDHVRVPVDALLDRFASIDAEGRYQSPIPSAGKRFFTMLGTLVGGRICVGSAGVSVAKSALAIAIRYSLARRQFGPGEGVEVPLLTYPTHQRRLLVPLATTYVLHFAFERLRAHFVEVYTATEPDTRALEAEAAALKVIATWHATDTVQRCREACGGQGYLAVNRLAQLKADCDVFSTFEGDNTVLLQLVGKSLLTHFQKQIGGGGLSGMVRMLASIAATTVAEKNPVDTRRTDPGHLRERRWQIATLAYREQTLVRTVALRMQKRLRAKMEPHAALLEIQEHLVAASRAYTDRLVLESFEQALAAIADDETRRTLARLGDLHALARIEQDAGWYLEDGWLAPPKARAIRKEVEAAMRELVPEARALVDAFGIPDACLAAPIAFFDPAHPP